MTPAERAALRREAEAEFAAGEELMLVAPIALVALLDDVDRLKRKLSAVDAYAELHDA